MEKCLKELQELGLTETEARYYYAGIYVNLKGSTNAKKETTESVCLDEVSEAKAGGENALTKYLKKKEKLSDEKKSFIIALLKATEAAEGNANDDDGGTCNMDCPALRYDGMREKEMQRLCMAAGLFCDKMQSRYSVHNFHIYGFSKGQGNRRANMVETFVNSMIASGYDCVDYSVMD